jgi:hypothetical protein
MGAMSLRERSWYPWAAAALWTAVVFGLVLVNTGSVILGTALGLVTGAITHRIESAGSR